MPRGFGKTISIHTDSEMGDRALIEQHEDDDAI